MELRPLRDVTPPAAILSGPALPLLFICITVLLVHGWSAAAELAQARGGDQPAVAEVQHRSPSEVGESTDEARSDREPGHSREIPEWLRELAASGDVRAQYRLGSVLRAGRAGPEGRLEAIEWFRRAAEQGHLEAQYRFGLSIRNGYGIAYDANEAQRWLTLAAQAGHKAARELLGPERELRDLHLRNGHFLDQLVGSPPRVRSPNEIRRGPEAPVVFGADRTIDCDFRPRDNAGGNPKFRCFMMTAPKTDGGHYHDFRGEVQPRATGVKSYEIDGSPRSVLVADGIPLTYRQGFWKLPLAPLELKIKYRRLDRPDPVKHRDMYSEVLATRLLWALGFAADRVYSVESVRCHGCPRDPFHATESLPGRYETFSDASVELRYRAGSVVTLEDRFEGGWAWHDEVWRLRYGIGVDGFTNDQKTQFDGLVLLMNILQHVSNPAHQNRLVCDRKQMQRIGTWKFCPAPTLLVHDLGSVLGKKHSRSLRAWRRTPIWRFATGCETALPFKVDRAGERDYLSVGQSGRQFLLQLMDQFTDAHWLALLETARFERFDATLHSAARGSAGPRRDQVYEEWIEGFREKVEEIRGRECPEI